VEDVHIGQPLALFHFKQATPELEVDLDEWGVDKIVAHRHNAAGDLEFQVRWLGSDEMTWEPVSNFFLQYAVAFIAYCRNKGLHVDVIDYLARHPSDVAAVRGNPVSVSVLNALLAPQQQEHLEWVDPPEDWPVEFPFDSSSFLSLPSNPSPSTPISHRIPTPTPSQESITPTSQKHSAALPDPEDRVSVAPPNCAAALSDPEGRVSVVPLSQGAQE
jgi:hypothetical protein